jgi:hypothetical protein
MRHGEGKLGKTGQLAKEISGIRESSLDGSKSFRVIVEVGSSSASGSLSDG